MSYFEMILTDYFKKGNEKMTEEEKGVILAALSNYEIAIQNELTRAEHTQEEIKQAFDTWNTVTRLIAKYKK